MINISYSAILWKAMPYVLLVSLGISLASYLLLARVPVVYEVHYSYLISFDVRPEVPEGQYAYDGYYALSSMDIFSSLVAGLVRSPEIIALAHDAGGLPLPTRSARSLVRLVSSEKSVPGLVQVVVRGDTPVLTQALADGLESTVASELEKYSEATQNVAKFRAVAGSRWVGVNEISVPLIVSMVFFASLFLGINLVLLRATFLGDSHK